MADEHGELRHQRKLHSYGFFSTSGVEEPKKMSKPLKPLVFAEWTKTAETPGVAQRHSLRCSCLLLAQSLTELLIHFAK